MTEQEWDSLKAGDIIYLADSYIPQKILNKANRCITLKILHKSWTGRPTTTYCRSSRYLFSRRPNYDKHICVKCGKESNCDGVCPKGF